MICRELEVTHTTTRRKLRQKVGESSAKSPRKLGIRHPDGGLRLLLLRLALLLLREDAAAATPPAAELAPAAEAVQAEAEAA